MRSLVVLALTCTIAPPSQLDCERNEKERRQAALQSDALKWELVNQLQGREPSVYPSGARASPPPAGVLDALAEKEQNTAARALGKRRLTPPPRSMDSTTSSQGLARDGGALVVDGGEMTMVESFS
jgi:hypothetical protein